MEVIHLYKNMNQTNIVDMTADTSRRIWKSMSNWRLYSFNQNELNRRVQESGPTVLETYITVMKYQEYHFSLTKPPWSNYFVDVFSRAAKQLIGSTQYDIERVSIPNFYFTNLVQRASIEGMSLKTIKICLI